MEIIDYTDFESYFYSHDELTPMEICINYLNELDADEYILEIIEEIEKDCKNI